MNLKGLLSVVANWQQWCKDTHFCNWIE